VISKGGSRGGRRAELDADEPPGRIAAPARERSHVLDDGAVRLFGLVGL
jgi:hypothetical protein